VNLLAIHPDIPPRINHTIILLISGIRYLLNKTAKINVYIFKLSPKAGLIFYY
jgi:hypothetical protein